MSNWVWAALEVTKSGRREIDVVTIFPSGSIGVGQEYMDDVPI